MSGALFLQGMGIGFAIAAPVGPIGVLCIRRSLSEGFPSGFATGLGAATADAAYGLLAGLGISAVGIWLAAADIYIRVIGGLIMLWLAWLAWRAPVGAEAAQVRVRGKLVGGGLVGAWASTFLLTLANPSTILSFAAIFAGLGLGSSDGLDGALWVAGGCFVGSALWWLGLAGLAGAGRAKVTPDIMRWINRGSAAVLGGFGLAALLL